MKRIKFSFALIIFLLCANNVKGQQLINLDAPSTHKFTITDRIWPANIGEAHICLWDDDKIAATSITIDDNNISEHDWWLSMQEKYEGLKFTWFLIFQSGLDWGKFQALIDSGHEVQAHDYMIGSYTSHGKINNASDTDYHNGMQSLRDTINAMLSNNSCITMAYPNGIAKPDPIRDVYIAMRGVYGTMNNANYTNYLDVNSRSSPNDVHDIRVLLDPKEQLYYNSYYRGWLSYHYHSISSKQAETDTFLSALSERRDSIWIAGFSEIAKYGQERDSHTLTVNEVNGKSIKITLSDQMNDKFFDYPLTLKIRISNSWHEISATQGAGEIESEIIVKDSDNYALIKAVPDKGEITIIPTSASNVSAEGVTILQENTILSIGDTSVLKVIMSPIDATDNSVTWLSLDSSIATIDEYGNLVGIAQGNATIKAISTDGGFVDSCLVKVVIPASGVSLSDSQLNLLITDSVYLIAIISPSNAYNDTILWSSSDTAIATVSNSGLVTGVAEGSTTIIVTSMDGGFTDSCQVTVKLFSNIKEVQQGVDFVVYPNPCVGDEIMVKLSGKYIKTGYINITDISGKIVNKQQFYGPGTINLNVKDLGRGIYFIMITNTGYTKQTKLILQ